MHDNSTSLTLTPSDLLSLPINNLPNQYVLNITLPQQSQSLTFYFFLGDPPASASSSSSSLLSSAKNLLATYAIFSKTPGSPGASNNVGITSHAIVPISAKLYNFVLQGVISNLDLKAVGPLLNQKRIRWTSTVGNNLPGLTVEVLQRDVVPATNLEELPEYGDWKEGCERCVDGLA